MEFGHLFAAPAGPTETAASRARFPRGLAQPEQGFRFGADTLLLAAFAARGLKGSGPLSGLDLGTGCGAASLGLLLLRPELDLRIVGLDLDAEMLAAARANARALGLEERFRTHEAEAGAFRPEDAGLKPGGCRFALANPPFRAPGAGRSCPDPSRGRARFEGPGGFAAFAACAARCLCTGGRFFLVHLAERLPELLRMLEGAGLPARRVLPVQGHAGKAPRLVLLEALRAGRGGFELCAPLVLYAADGSLTPQALAFCPALGANPRRSGQEAPRTLANQGDAE